MAVSLSSVALNERSGTEVLQAGARRLQGLTTASITHSRVLECFEDRSVYAQTMFGHN